MPKHNVTVYSLLISCPSDIKKEVEIIRNVVEKLNKKLIITNDIMIKILYWKDDVAPEIGEEDGQSIINNQIVKNADAVIAIFWKKVGSKTPRHESGTIEEIEEMLKAKKQVFLYFSQKSIKMEDLENIEDFQKIKEIKKEYGSKGIYGEYKNDNDFEKQIDNHLFNYFSRIKNNDNISSTDEYNNIPDDKKITIKSYNNDILKNTLEYHEMINNSNSIINSEKEKIIKLIEEIKSIDLGMPYYINNGLVKSLYYIENWDLVQTFAFQNNIVIDINNFFNLGNYNPNTNYFGTEWRNIHTGETEIIYPKFENEEKKYSLITKLISNIDFYNKIKKSIEYLSNIRCLSLAVVNENSRYDENIAVCIKIPKKHFINKDYFNELNSNLLNKLIYDSIFKRTSIVEGTTIDCYNKIDIGKNHIETIESLYKEYEFDPNSDYVNLIFKIKELNACAGIWFPSVLLFDEEIDEITYFITSKKLGKTEGIIKK
ncbi:hypothetical protein [Brachyspira hyodysenteriae]|uniref:hypothetical protein n=2 Tax=Brachyspira hyodysenteriae TaxID=159 RepID=UPI0011830B2A|nr:hypothetical protein [Brachyspira hyodysenteriae]TVL68257.1 hypothetical protein A9X76_06465 [Brachyspira hyodysenteriae]